MYANGRADVHIAAWFERERLNGVQWKTTEAVRIFNDMTTELELKQVGVVKTLTPLPLEDEPELQALPNAIDYEGFG